MTGHFTSYKTRPNHELATTRLKLIVMFLTSDYLCCRSVACSEDDGSWILSLLHYRLRAMGLVVLRS